MTFRISINLTDDLRGGRADLTWQLHLKMAGLILSWLCLIQRWTQVERCGSTLAEAHHHESSTTNSTPACLWGKITVEIPTVTSQLLKSLDLYPQAWINTNCKKPSATCVSRGIYNLRLRVLDLHIVNCSWDCISIGQAQDSPEQKSPPIGECVELVLFQTFQCDVPEKPRVGGTLRDNAGRRQRRKMPRVLEEKFLLGYVPPVSQPGRGSLCGESRVEMIGPISSESQTWHRSRSPPWYDRRQRCRPRAERRCIRQESKSQPMS